MKVGAIVVAAAVVGTACIEPQLQPCGDKLCALEAVCLPSGDCAPREIVDACAGLDDGAVCQTTTFDGTCAGGACVAPRCGDGIVAAGGAEQCDGPIVQQDCVDYGFDLGIPACTATCNLDVIDACTRFGWTRIAASPTESMWSNGSDALAFTTLGTNRLELRSALGTFTDDTDEWSMVAGNATTVYAIGVSSVKKSTGGPWEPLPPSTVSPWFSTVTGDGTLYVGSDGPCQIAKLPPGGAWTPILNDVEQCNDIEATSTGILVAFQNGEIRRYTSAIDGWAVEIPGNGEPVLSVLEYGGKLYWSHFNSGIFVRDGTQTSQITTEYAYDLVSAGPYIYLDNDGRYGRIDGDLLEMLTAPTFGEIYADPTGGMYVYNNGIYRLSRYAFAEHEGVTEVIYDMGLIGEDSPVIAAASGVLIRNNNNSWDEILAPDQITAIAGHATDDLFLAASDGLWLFDGNVSDLSPPASFVGVRDLWIDPVVNILYAVGDSGLILKLTNTSWSTQTLPPGSSSCNIAAINGTPADLYAVGECAGVGVVWKQAGSAWTEVYRGGLALAAVTTTTDGEVFAAGPDGGARTRSGVWEEEIEAKGISIGATTANDVFVGGGPGEMIYWDGIVWSRMGVTGANSPRVIVTRNAVYIGGATQAVLLR